MFCSWKLDKTSSNVEYLSKIAEIYIIDKFGLSAQTIKNSHSFLNVSYTWYKSLLIGFVWQHIAPLPINDTNWELTTPESIGFDLRDPASCITELAKKEITRTMHVFFRDYKISFPKCGKLNKKDLPTSCKGNLLTGIVNW